MTAALTWARVSYRQQRWELILVAVGVALTAIVMLWFQSQVEAAAAAAAPCLSALTDGVAQPSCQGILDAYYSTTGFADSLLLLSFGAPFGMGVLLGAPLVAREIDGGTAQLAWSIGRSRIWWLLRRIAFIALFVVVLLGVLALTSELLAAALTPERNLAVDFTWFGRRGWLIVARGLGALMVGMLVGAVIGRVLPSILAAILAVALVFTGLSFAQDRWMEEQAEVHRTNNFGMDGGTGDLGALFVGVGLETEEGETLTWSEQQERGLYAQYIDEQGRSFASEADMRAGRVLGYDVTFSIPGQRYGEVVLIVGGASAAVALIALLATALVVSRRRPA
jgi:uncharacterized protein YcfJ